MNFEVVVSRTQQRDRVARLADKYLSGPTPALPSADQVVATELLTDIVRLARKCERLSGIGYSSHVIEARQTADLKELAGIRDELFCDVTTYKEQRRRRHMDVVEALLPFGAAAVASIPALLFLGVPAYFLLKALFWS